MFLTYQELEHPYATRGKCQYQALCHHQLQCYTSNLGHVQDTMPLAAHNPDHPGKSYILTPKICVTCNNQLMFYILRVYTVYNKFIGSVVTV